MIELSEKLKRRYPKLKFEKPGEKLESICFIDNQPCLNRDIDVAVRPDDSNIIIRVYGAFASSCSGCSRNKVN